MSQTLPGGFEPLVIQTPYLNDASLEDSWGNGQQFLNTPGWIRTTNILFLRQTTSYRWATGTIRDGEFEPPTKRLRISYSAN